MFILILNYFSQGQLKTEIKDFKSTEQAMDRIRQLENSGIALSRSNYGIYRFEGHNLIEIKSVA